MHCSLWPGGNRPAPDRDGPAVLPPLAPAAASLPFHREPPLSVEPDPLSDSCEAGHGSVPMKASLPGLENPRTAQILLAARGARAFADGLVSLVLPVYLRELGYGPVETGVIATATLTGSALLTLAIGLNAHRASGRALLMGASLLMIGTGLAFAGIEEIWPLLVVSFVGTLNPSSGDVSAFL